MRNAIGYALLLGTFFGILVIGGTIVTGSLAAPLAAGLAVGYAIAGMGGMWLAWRKPKKTGYSPVYYDPETLKRLVENTPFRLANEVHPLPTTTGTGGQVFIYDAGPHGLKVGHEEKEL